MSCWGRLQIEASSQDVLGIDFGSILIECGARFGSSCVFELLLGSFVASVADLDTMLY